MLVLEKALAGGMLLSVPRIENYPGFPGGISGMELGQKMAHQAREAGAEIKELEEATGLDLKGVEKSVKTASGSEYKAKAIIIATGWSPLKLNVPGEEELVGRGVSYCAVCDGPLFRGKKVAVVGGEEQAVASALYMADIASEVTLITPGRRLHAPEALVERLAEKGVRVITRAKVERLVGHELLERVVLKSFDTGELVELQVQGLFVQVGIKPNSELARAAGVEVDGRGFIVVDEKQRTNIPGVFAAGDVTNKSPKQVCTAVAQGAVAALEAANYIRGAPAA